MRKERPCSCGRAGGLVWADCSSGRWPGGLCDGSQRGRAALRLRSAHSNHVGAERPDSADVSGDCECRGALKYVSCESAVAACSRRRPQPAAATRHQILGQSRVAESSCGCGSGRSDPNDKQQRARSAGGCADATLDPGAISMDSDTAALVTDAGPAFDHFAPPPRSIRSLNSSRDLHRSVRMFIRSRQACQHRLAQPPIVHGVAAVNYIEKEKKAKWHDDKL